jgi:hypothetical protein
MDERLMQFLRVTNEVLSAESSSAARRLAITPFAVTPLGPRLGLVQWVPDTVPLFQVSHHTSHIQPGGPLLNSGVLSFRTMDVYCVACRPSFSISVVHNPLLHHRNMQVQSRLSVISELNPVLIIWFSLVWQMSRFQLSRCKCTTMPRPGLLEVPRCRQLRARVRKEAFMLNVQIYKEHTCTCTPPDSMVYLSSHLISCRFIRDGSRDSPIRQLRRRQPSGDTAATAPPPGKPLLQMTACLSASPTQLTHFMPSCQSHLR